MVDMICLELALAFVILATLAAVATNSASRTVREVANKTVNGSITAALVSAVLAVLFLYWPLTSTVGSPPQQHAQNSSGPEGTRPGEALGTR